MLDIRGCKTCSKLYKVVQNKFTLLYWTAAGILWSSGGQVRSLHCIPQCTFDGKWSTLYTNSLGPWSQLLAFDPLGLEDVVLRALCDLH